jgi:two-component system CheB/CheR fusion protein
MRHDMATRLVTTRLQVDSPSLDRDCPQAGQGCDRCAMQRAWDTVIREVAQTGCAAAARLRKLSPRQHEIMQLVIAGHPSKNIAADLGISQRTVENHRASIMRKAGVRTISALVRMEMAASWADTAGQYR